MFVYVCRHVVHHDRGQRSSWREVGVTRGLIERELGVENKCCIMGAAREGL